MAIPTTSSSAEILLAVAFLLLGLWSSTFKMAGQRWRFELFSLDFALGAVAVSLVAAFSLGTFGSDLGLNEHMMISSKTSQALAFIAGGLFAFGSMLLLSATALLGLAFSYSIATAAALLALSLVEFSGFRLVFLALAMLAAIIALVFQTGGAKKAEENLPAVTLPVTVRKSSGRRGSIAGQPAGGIRNSTKGIVSALIGGLSLGALVLPFKGAIFGQFGLGVFAGMAVFSVSALASILVLNLFFMNVSIHGGSVGLGSYFRGSFLRHLLGWLGGALCGAGVLALALLSSFPAENQPDQLWLWAAALGAGLIAIALGLSVWSEIGAAPGSVMRSILLGAFFLIVAIGVFALAMDRTPPLPSPAQQGLLQAQPQG